LRLPHREWLENDSPKRGKLKDETYSPRKSAQKNHSSNLLGGILQFIEVP